MLYTSWRGKRGLSRRSKPAQGSAPRAWVPVTWAPFNGAVIVGETIKLGHGSNQGVRLNTPLSHPTYFEVTFNATSSFMLGAQTSPMDLPWNDRTNEASLVWSETGLGAVKATGSTTPFSTPGTYGIAIDPITHRLWVTNGVEWGGDPTNASGGVLLSNVAHIVFYSCGVGATSAAMSIEFDPTKWVYDAPSGFYSINK